MFTHALMFKYTDPENCAEEIGRRLLALQPHLTGLVSMSYSLDQLHTGRSYDALLYVVFEDKDSYIAYDKDEEHNRVRAFIRDHLAGSCVVDFES